MRVMFMGTPDIAVPCLEALIEKHNVVCVVTQPDKPKNRGQKMAMSPVKELALTHKQHYAFQLTLPDKVQRYPEYP